MSTICSTYHTKNTSLNEDCIYKNSTTIIANHRDKSLPLLKSVLDLATQIFENFTPPAKQPIHSTNLKHAPKYPNVPQQHSCKIVLHRSLTNKTSQNISKDYTLIVINFLHLGLLEYAIRILPKVSDATEKKLCFHRILFSIIENDTIDSLISLFSGDTIKTMPLHDKEELFSDAIASLLFTEHVSTAIQLAELAPQTSQMSEMLHDYVLGLFFGGKLQEAHDLMKFIHDNDIKEITQWQMSQNPLKVSTVLSGSCFAHSESFMIERNLDPLDETIRLMRQFVGQGHPEKMITTCFESSSMTTPVLAAWNSGSSYPLDSLMLSLVSKSQYKPEKTIPQKSLISSIILNKANLGLRS
jgi:hypothetical protein